MRNIIKVLGIAVAALAVILVVAAFLLWRLFDPNNIREELETFVEERTGREFSIDDGLALTLFPWLGIETGQMRLGHAPGFGDDDFASVESATARVRLMPLFRGRMEFGAVVLEGLELNLARDADGLENWSDLLSTASPAIDADGAGAPADAAEEPFFSEVDIAGIDIRNGIVFWRENVDEVRYVISDIVLGTGPIAPGMPVDIDLGLQWVGVDPSFTAQLDGRTSLVPDSETAGLQADGLLLQFRVEDGQGDERIAGNLETTATFDNTSGIIRLDNLQLESDLTGFTGSPDPVSVTAVAPAVSVDASAWTAEVPEVATTIDGITARWHLTAASLTGEPSFAGTVAIAESPVEEALALLGMEYDAAMGDFDLSSGFLVEPLAGRVSLSGLDAALLDMAVTGNLALGDTDLSGDLQAPTFDPGVFFSVLPPEWLDGADVTSIEQLALSADFTVNRTDNGFSLRDFAVALPGGTISGSADRPADAESISGRIVASDLDPDVVADVFPALLPDALGPERLGTLGVDTAFDYASDGSILRLEELAASALGLQASGDLTVRDPTGSPDVTGTLQLANFSPRALLERFDRDVPPTADPAVLGNATLSADISFGANRAEFASLQMRLDDTNLSGRVEVADFADPRFVFELDMDRINLDRYFPPTSEAPNDPDQEDQGFDTATLADLNLAGRISADELQVSGLSVSGFSTDIEFAEGLGGIEPLEASLYGGEFQGAAELDVRAGGPFVSLQGAGYDVDMEGLLSALSGEPARTSGRGSFDVELTGIGDNLDGVLSTATGSIEFELRDGAQQVFSGFVKELYAISNLICLLGDGLQTVDATRFSLVRGTAQIRDGIASTTDILGNLETMEVTGGGRVDLVTHGIDLGLDAEMTAGIPIPGGCETLDALVGETIPVLVSGTLSDPQYDFDYDFDFEELIKQRLQEEAGEAGEAGEALLDAVLDLLN